MSALVESLVKKIETMSVAELVALTKRLQDQYDVVPANQVVQAIPGDAIPEPVVEEQLYFDVVLTAVGDKKIQVVKTVREITKLGLKEAKDLVDKATVEPSVLATGLEKPLAEQMKERVEAEGATVELR